MTEETIIDGVNVATCKDFLEPDGCDNTDTLSMTCSRNNNCYYKQLKRAEIEIKKLKGVDGSVHPDSAYYKIRRLEQENKRLNERLYCYAYEKDCHLQCKQKDCAIKNYYKYKSALEEIRELVEKSIKISYNLEVNSMLYDITDKIKEVLK